MDGQATQDLCTHSAHRPHPALCCVCASTRSDLSLAQKGATRLLGGPVLLSWLSSSCDTWLRARSLLRISRSCFLIPRPGQMAADVWLW